MDAIEAELIAEGDRLRLENVAAINKRQAPWTTTAMYGPGLHYHRRSVMDAAVALIHGLRSDFEAIVFPCCGFAITETLVLERTFPHSQAIFMDRHVDRRVRRRPNDIEAASFQELAAIVQGLTVSTLVVGINSMVSDCCKREDRMRDDPGFHAFVRSLVRNTRVHRHAVLAWMDGLCGGCGASLLPLAELTTFTVKC